ncbi:MAG: ABC transporter substrate-binding protein, partial [Candidatus Aegiribacteria sp.]|nr:ABC transporter substrate-binding protein [Candidatus Aegiribacteria sp.]MBD3294277.1 ABC transporter substrate-binding protein [Candidatus Fermentibacteria bacterium]
RRPQFEARPYAIANPGFSELPVFGEFRGHDNPELIVALEPQPQLIFKTYASMGMDPVELEEKTGIPVVVLNYGNFTSGREDFYSSLRTMGEIMDRNDRAEEVIAFMDSCIEDLKARTENVPDEERPSCYVGGIAYRGPHGFQSTEPAYPPFVFVNADHVALAGDDPWEAQEHADVAKEQIVAWDPEYIFVDLSTLQSDPEASALYQLRTDPAYAELQAVENGNVYGMLPYNWYTKNYGSILADAYFAGKTLYPESFADIDPAAKADEIYDFLVGQSVFGRLRTSFEDMVFEGISI